MSFLSNAIESTTWGPVHLPMLFFTEFSLQTRKLSPIPYAWSHAGGFLCLSALWMRKEAVWEQISIRAKLAQRHLSCTVAHWSGGEIGSLSYSPNTRAEATSLPGPSVLFIALIAHAKGICLSTPRCSLFSFRSVLRSGEWYRSPISKLFWASRTVLDSSTSEAAALLMKRSPKWGHCSVKMRLGKPV